MSTYKIPTFTRTNAGQENTFVSPHGLRISVDGKRTRYAIGGWNENTAKVADCGSRLQGPHAYFFKLGSVMTAERGAGVEHETLSVQSGDLLVVEGVSYLVSIERINGLREPVLHPVTN
jgi:hypothetical protein